MHYNLSVIAKREVRQRASHLDHESDVLIIEAFI